MRVSVCLCVCVCFASLQDNAGSKCKTPFCCLDETAQLPPNLAVQDRQNHGSSRST